MERCVARFRGLVKDYARDPSPLAELRIDAFVRLMLKKAALLAGDPLQPLLSASP